MDNAIKKALAPLFLAVFSFLFLTLLAMPPVAAGWGIGEKDIKDIRNDIAVVYEKLNALQRDNIDVLVRNQASQNADLASVRDDAQHIQTKLDELALSIGKEMEKNRQTLAGIQEKLNAYSQETPKLVQQIITESDKVQKEENQTRMAALEAKLGGLMDLLKTFLETQKAEKDKAEAHMKGTSDKVAELVKISKEAIQELAKKPEAQTKQVSGDLAKIDKKILELVDIMKSSIVENSKAMKNTNDSIVKLMKSIDQQLAELSGGGKKKQ